MKIAGLLALTLCIILLPEFALSESPSELVCGEFESLAESLQDLVAELRESNQREARHRELLIAVEYLQFRSRSIESLEQEVRRTEDRRTNVIDTIDRMTSDIKAIEVEKTQTAGEEAEEFDSMIKRYTRRIKSYEDNSDRLEQKIYDLENQIIDNRRQLLSLEEYVVENLDLEE
jgi:chromosome segregation ATPase